MNGADMTLIGIMTMVKVLHMDTTGKTVAEDQEFRLLRFHVADVTLLGSQ
jgi:hypothetical protein